MKYFRNRKTVLLAIVLMLGIVLVPYAHALEMHHHSMDMNDCSTSVHCLACGNPLPASARVDDSLSPSLDTVSCLLILKIVGPAVSHYHPPG